MLHDLPDSHRTCWVNKYDGKLVKINLDISGGIGGGLMSLSGTFIRLDKFQYRWYLVIVQDGSVTEVNINIDHILTIEEK